MQLENIKLWVIAVAGLIILLVSRPAQCADVHFEQRPNIADAWDLHFDGEIKTGDAKKLAALIEAQPEKFLTSTNLILNSPGGSVEEALQISKILEQSGLASAIRSDDVCASACFILFISTPFRSVIAGKLLIHRPYYKMAGATVADYDKYAEAQRSATAALRSYLQARSIPSDLIDNMMSLPSNSAYQVTWVDLKRIGLMSPVVEEAAIEKCGISSDYFWSAIKTFSTEIYLRGFECVENSILVHIRVHYLDKTLGVEKTLKVLQKVTE